MPCLLDVWERAYKSFQLRFIAHPYPFYQLALPATQKRYTHQSRDSLPRHLRHNKKVPNTPETFVSRTTKTPHRISLLIHTLTILLVSLINPKTLFWNSTKKKDMCGGAILADFIPRNRSRGVDPSDLWPNSDFFSKLSHTNSADLPKPIKRAKPSSGKN